MNQNPSEYLTVRTGWFSSKTIRLNEWKQIKVDIGSASCCSMNVAFEHKTTGEVVKGSITYDELIQLKGGDAW
jgi:hypothetical protein